MNKDQRWGKFIECECGCEGIMVSTDTDTPHLCLAFFGNWFNNTLDWKKRLSFCWRILKSGTPYSDMVLLTPKSAAKLAVALHDFVDNHIQTETNLKTLDEVILDVITKGDDSVTKKGAPCACNTATCQRTVNKRRGRKSAKKN